MKEVRAARIFRKTHPNWLAIWRLELRVPLAIWRQARLTGRQAAAPVLPVVRARFHVSSHIWALFLERDKSRQAGVSLAGSAVAAD